MNVDQVKAALERNKKPLAIAGAAAVAGLGLLKARSGGTSTGSTGGSAAARTTAAAKPSGVAVSGYAPSTADTGMSDAFSALTSQLSGIYDSLNPPIPVPGVPPPAASQMYAPNRTGNYWMQGAPTDGSTKAAVFEVQTDGSLYHLSGSEWTNLVKELGKGDEKNMPINRLLGPYVPSAFYRGVDNAAARSTGKAGERFTTTATGAHQVYKG